MERQNKYIQASEIREFCLILNFLGGGSPNKCKLQIMTNMLNLTYLYFIDSILQQQKVDVPVFFIYMLGSQECKINV